MVRRCGLCKLEQGMISNVSFHRIPDNLDLKTKWFKNIDRELSANSSICSRHFEEQDFSYKKYGENIKRFLLSTAVPVCFTQSSNSLPVSIGKSALNTANSGSGKILSDITNTAITNDSNNSSNSFFIENNDCVEASRIVNDTDSSNEVDNSITKHVMSNSDFNVLDYRQEENTILKRKLDEPFVQKKRLSNPRYIGDLSREDFTSDIAWHIVNEHVNHCRKKQKSLTEKVKRSINKVESLKSLLQHLRSNGLLSDEACNKLEVSLLIYI